MWHSFRNAFLIGQTNDNIGWLSMSTFFIPMSNMPVDTIPESFNSLEKQRDRTSYGGLERILGTTVAILNQTQAELEQSKKEIAALKKEMAALERVATTDVLTGLKNRRGFEDAFARELSRTRRGKSVGGVLVVIDLDSFKAINDTYGHQAGDACLRLVSKALTEEVRDMDTAARLGGDEFVLILTDTTPELLLTRVQNIAWRLNHLCLDWEEYRIAINASVGMRPYKKGDNAAAVFAAADNNMYANKKREKEFV
jgi:diguanylate cyclase (GGDEF)-like protein